MLIWQAHWMSGYVAVLHPHYWPLSSLVVPLVAARGRCCSLPQRDEVGVGERCQPGRRCLQRLYNIRCLSSPGKEPQANQWGNVNYMCLNRTLTSTADFTHCPTTILVSFLCLSYLSNSRPCTESVNKNDPVFYNESGRCASRTHHRPGTCRISDQFCVELTVMH